MRYARRSAFPLSPVAVDWANPMTRDLVLAWTPAQKERNLANGRTFAAANGVLDMGSNSIGEGCQIASGSTSFSYSDSLSGPTSKTEFSVIVACALDQGRSADLISLGSGTGSSGNYIVLCTDGSSPAALQWKIFVAAYQIMASARSYVGGHVFGAMNSVAESRREIWADGTVDNSSATTFTTGSTDNKFAFLFADSNTGLGRQVTSPVNLVLVWNRALSTVEMATLTANPWLVFRSKPRTLAFDVRSVLATGLGQRWFLTH